MKLIVWSTVSLLFYLAIDSYKRGKRLKSLSKDINELKSQIDEKFNKKD